MAFMGQKIILALSDVHHSGEHEVPPLRSDRLPESAPATRSCRTAKDARRPSRERESLVGERSRIINRMKSALARLGIRGFKAHLRKAPERLETLRTPEGTALPPNILEEFRRDMARLALVREQIVDIEKSRIERLQRAPDTGPHAMVRLLAKVIGIAIETADMLVQEVLSRNLRDRRAVARYAGLTGSPDESGTKRREKGLAKAGNARVRRGLIQLAWRFLQFQKQSTLVKWFRLRTEGPSGARKTTMIVALARKLLIALLAEVAAILPRHPNRMSPLLGKARVVDDPGRDRAMPLDRRQYLLPHLRQHAFVRPTARADEMQQRLMLCRHPRRLCHSRQRLHALALARQHQAKAIVAQRTFTVLVPDHARKPIHIPLKPRSTVISKVHLSPHAGRKSPPLSDSQPRCPRLCDSVKLRVRYS